MLTFEWPWLLVLLPLPWLVWRFVPPAEDRQTALLVPFFEDATSLQQGGSHEGNQTRAKLLALGVIWFCLLLSAMRPHWVGEAVNLPASGRDLLLAVDISGSMKTPDMNWNGEYIDRLTTVKQVVGDFVVRRESDRLGLVLFGTRAYLQAPLTFDRKTVNQLLQEAQLGFAGEKTAIGDAIGLAVKRLRNRPENSRVVILLTDGANTAGEVDPLQAAELAAQSQVKIYTIGVGADEMITPGLFGSRFGSRRINPSRDLDEASLREIAKVTGGRYFRARNPQDLTDIYRELDTLEPIEQEAEVFRPTQALFYWPLAVAFFTSLALALLPLFSFVKSRHSTVPQPEEATG